MLTDPKTRLVLAESEAHACAHLRMPPPHASTNVVIIRVLVATIADSVPFDINLLWCCSIDLPVFTPAWDAYVPTMLRRTEAEIVWQRERICRHFGRQAKGEMDV